MRKIIKSIFPTLLFFSLLLTFFFSFLSENYIKGTFHTDEPGIVLGSLNPNRKIGAIFKEAASIAQPPLENIIRDKIYVPLGKAFRVSKIYPEFFHRFLSLLWWLIPIGYFCLNLKDFSRQKKLTITLAFFLIASSEFFRFYLAEARQYSAIAATYATMIIILLSDKVSCYGLRYRFLIISLLPPLLHLISFPFYLALVVFFFYRLAKESFREHKTQFFDLITIFSIYLLFIIWMYLQISKLSADWQHPKLSSISISYIDSRLKWTLDWIFYGSPLYPLFKLIPSVIKDRLVITFGLLSIPSLISLFQRMYFSKNKNVEVTAIFPLIITLVWPVTMAAVTARSGMFSGERYSIDILIIIFFGASGLIANFLLKLKNKNVKYLTLALIFIATGICLFPKIISAKYFNLTTAENRFVKENKNLLANPDNHLILDNGGYSTSVALLAIIYNIPLKAEYFPCHEGTFQANGKNIMNSWLKNLSFKNIYLLTAGKELEGNNKLIWSSGLEKLYKLEYPINNNNLCSSPIPFGECYLRCTKGYGLSPDGRSIPGTTPHIDIYRP